MGIDIDGWVEVLRKHDDGYQEWEGVIKIRWLVERNYSMFNGLFGRGTIGDYHPVAAGRGMPSDISDEVQRGTFGNAVVAPSWILQRELDAVDWDEVSAWPGSRAGGEPQERRRDTITPGWSILFEMMRLLAARYENAGVRLVAWLDS